MHGTGQLLSEWLRDHKEAVGGNIVVEGGDKPVQLPFLFKVLSVNKALSIQSHPTKVRSINQLGQSIK